MEIKKITQRLSKSRKLSKTNKKNVKRNRTKKTFIKESRATKIKKTNFKNKNERYIISRRMRGGALTLKEHIQNKKKLSEALEELNSNILMDKQRLEIESMRNEILKLTGQIIKLNKMKINEKNPEKLNRINKLLNIKEINIDNLRSNISKFESTNHSQIKKKTELDKIIKPLLKIVKEGNILFPEETIKHSTSKIKSSNNNVAAVKARGTQKPPSSVAGPARNGPFIGNSVRGKKPNTTINSKYNMEVNNLERRLAAL